MFVSKMCKAKDFGLCHETNPIVLMVIRQAIKDSGIKFDLTSHKKLWSLLEENPGSWKVEWIEEVVNNGNGEFPMRDCFACEFASRLLDYIGNNYGISVYRFLAQDENTCVACPFTISYSSCLDEVYDDWVDKTEEYRVDLNEELFDEISEYAGMIKNFDVRTDIEIPLK